VSILPGACWAIIPARGGSKSIPLKNLAPFAGRPLIDYNIFAGQQAPALERILCSTDSSRIAEHCLSRGVEVAERPERLSGDETPVLDVILDLLESIERKEGAVPEAIALLQPTSPFILPEQIGAAVEAMLSDPAAGSAQTIAECRHNQHAFNQRVVSEGFVRFRFAAERNQAYNKQRKPRHYVFGNVVVTRVAAMREQRLIHAEPSVAIEIDWPYDFDADDALDFTLGEALLASGLVDLPHMPVAAQN